MQIGRSSYDGENKDIRLKNAFAVETVIKSIETEITESKNALFNSGSEIREW